MRGGSRFIRNLGRNCGCAFQLQIKETSITENGCLQTQSDNNCHAQLPILSIELAHVSSELDGSVFIECRTIPPVYIVVLGLLR